MDLTVFDRAVKSQFPEWKGFATTSLRSRKQILANVYNLDLSSCSLSTVPQGIFECINLKYLDISDNNLNELPAKLFQMPHLVWLGINNKDFDSLNISTNSISEHKKQKEEIKNSPIFGNTKFSSKNIMYIKESYELFDIQEEDKATIENLTKVINSEFHYNGLSFYFDNKNSLFAFECLSKELLAFFSNPQGIDKIIVTKQDFYNDSKQIIASTIVGISLHNKQKIKSTYERDSSEYLSVYLPEMMQVSSFEEKEVISKVIEIYKRSSVEELTCGYWFNYFDEQSYATLQHTPNLSCIVFAKGVDFDLEKVFANMKYDKTMLTVNNNRFIVDNFPILGTHNPKSLHIDSNKNDIKIPENFFSFTELEELEWSYLRFSDIPN
jgi:Leucine-rich repeat (LRR) protein